jgi:hypothetical protein
MQLLSYPEWGRTCGKQVDLLSLLQALGLENKAKMEKTRREYVIQGRNTRQGWFEIRTDQSNGPPLVDERSRKTRIS